MRFVRQTTMKNSLIRPWWSIWILAVLLSPACLAYAQAPIPTLDSEEWNFITLINNFRAQNGIAPLQVSIALENATQWMSNDMASNNYYSHTDSLGRAPNPRVEAFGYPTGVSDYIGEGYVDGQSYFNAWLQACNPNAAGDCTYSYQKLMLATAYKVVGVGRAYNSSSAFGWYWNIDFGTILDSTLTPSEVPLPTIAYFTALPATITAGQSASLSWSVSGASSLSINNGLGDVSGTTTKSVSPTSTTTYTLTATDIRGSTVSQVTVTVNPAVVSPPVVTQPPSVPTLSAAAKSATEVDLSWTASTDNVGVAGYQISRSGSTPVKVPSGTLSYADMTVSPQTTYTYFVKAYDAAGNYSNASNSVQVTTPAAVISNTCPAPATNAYTACYYSNTTLSGNPVYTATASQLSYYYATGFPGSFVPVVPNDFSVSWLGNFTFAAGAYTFTAVVSDGIKIYVDGNLVLSSWLNQPPSEHSASQTLTQGTHLVTVDFYDQTGYPTAFVWWSQN